jgi:hypothetical protein
VSVFISTAACPGDESRNSAVSIAPALMVTSLTHLKALPLTVTDSWYFPAVISGKAKVPFAEVFAE